MSSLLLFYSRSLTLFKQSNSKECWHNFAFCYIHDLHSLSKRTFWCFSCIIAMVHRNSSTVEIKWGQMGWETKPIVLSVFCTFFIFCSKLASLKFPGWLKFPFETAPPGPAWVQGGNTIFPDPQNLQC